MVLAVGLILLARGAAAQGNSLSETIEAIKPGIVGVGSYEALRRPAIDLRGTGFIVGDGQHVATNFHVIEAASAADPGAGLSIFIGTGADVDAREATVVATDKAHDIALLKFSGPPGPPLVLAGYGEAREGQSIAFTGFPIGAVYGFYPVTHRGILSAITPIVIPQVSPQQLNAEMIRRLRGKFDIYQLDATAYPGNSGSPVYAPDTGRVVAVISSVFIKQSKERILSEPSGITFAIPIAFLRNLLAEHDLIAIGAEGAPNGAAQ